MKKLLFPLLLLFALSSCDTESKEQKDKPAAHGPEYPDMESPPSPSLTDTLNAKKEAFLAKASPEKIASYDRGIEAVAASGILETAINVGDTAPDFLLHDATGKGVALHDYTMLGPVILTWYRGGWCPYCNLTLHYLQEYLPKFKAAGANLMALTPELPDSSLSTAEKHGLQFVVLSDVHNQVAKQYGIVFTLIDEVAASYQKGFGLHEYNGDESNELPLAATYVIGRDRVVKWAYLDKDYRNRAEPEEILRVVRGLE